MKTRHCLAAFAMTFTAVVAPVRADSDGEALEKLRQQVEALQRRVSALESLTTFTTLMPNFAERFHVMHHAGEAGDWAVASHELAEMQRIARISPSIDEKKGRLLKAMMAPSFADLDDAIEHGDGARFEGALVQTITTCNACHAATGSGFVEITLDVPDMLSLRHPHKLVAQEVPERHTHEMPKGGAGTMHDERVPEHGHDDTGTSKHTH